MSRSLYWILAPFLVITAIALPLLIDNWTIGRAIIMIGLELFMIGLLIGLWDIWRFEWALRSVAGLIFLAYVAYVASMLMQGVWASGARSKSSIVNAIAGLLFWGAPALGFAIKGLGKEKSELLVVFASSNPHKLEEVRAVLAPANVMVLGLDELDELEDVPPEPIEDGATFEENARIKATAYARAVHCACLADDSGLEVDALNGAPGVHSARYAGIGNNRGERDAANNAKLLNALRDIPMENRTGRFVCAMCLADEDGNILAETRGTFEGVITDQPRGNNGFGYDPLLYLPDRHCTSAELSPDEKNARSHRGDASRKMIEKIRHLLQTSRRPIG